MPISSLSRAVSTLLLVLILSTAIEKHFTDAERIIDKIYSTIQSNHYCSRRLNSTHQVGCSSDLGGNFGIIWIVDSPDDLNHILQSGPTPPYIAILNRASFTRENLLRFKNYPDRVSGVVFLDGDHENSKLRTSPFSPEDTCPNRYSGLYVNNTKYANCKQNSWVKESPISGLLYEDIPYPIFLINDKRSIDEIQACFKTHNFIASKSQQNTDEATSSHKTQAPYPLCGLQLDSFMLAAQNSDLCLNSHHFIDELLQSNGRRCDSVDNHNIFAYYKPAFGPMRQTNITDIMLPDVAPPESIVMIITKLSSISMFSDISPGADSTISSIVTMLAIAQALGSVKNSTKVRDNKRNIAFAVLDSEPFDYTGSSRMIYSMLENVFPNSYFIRRANSSVSEAMLNTNFSSIEYVINLDQMANYPNSDILHFHAEPEDNNRGKIDRLFNVMDKVSVDEKLKLQREDSELPLPPTPVQEFIRNDRKLGEKRGGKLTGVVVSNYGKSYNNLFYHGIYDDSHNVYQTSKEKLVEHIARVSRIIARSVFEIAFQVDDSESISVDKKLIEELLQCYLNNADCHLFTRASTAGQKLPSGPVQTYKDPTKRSDDMNGVITAHLLAYFLGDTTDLNATKCMDEHQKSMIYNYEYINGKDEPVTDGSSGLCIRSQVAMLSAQSPAYSFTQDGVLLINPDYPAWTVSLNGIRNPVRLYLIPSPVSQWATFVLGIVITIASFIIVHELKKSIAKINSQVVVAQTATPT